MLTLTITYRSPITGQPTSTVLRGVTAYRLTPAAGDEHTLTVFLGSVVALYRGVERLTVYTGLLVCIGPDATDPALWSYLLLDGVSGRVIGATTRLTTAAMIATLGLDCSLFDIGRTVILGGTHALR